MRYPPEHKDAVRARIVAAAARALRARGFEGVSVPGLMKAAGLTHGGFYRHFRAREALVVEACRAAAEETRSRVLAGPADLEGMLGGYLSREHLEHPEAGCVVAALGADARRQTPAVRRAFSELALGLLREVERKLRPDSPPGALGDDALRLGSQMVGALVLARLVKDPTLADRLLAAARTPP